jgi:hypothetical protein
MLTGQLKGNKYVIGEDKVMHQYIGCNSIIAGELSTLD